MMCVAPLTAVFATTTAHAVDNGALVQGLTSIGVDGTTVGNTGSVATAGLASTGVASPGSASQPGWWHGTCDTNDDPNSVEEDPGIDGVIVCGPGPDVNPNDPDYAVQFYPGAVIEYQWECVEFAQRYMYLVWGIKPWAAGTGRNVAASFPAYGSQFQHVYDNTGQIPQIGDVMSMNSSSPNGHVAVVVSSGMVNGHEQVTLVGENTSSPKITLTASTAGGHLSGAGFSAIDWVHRVGGPVLSCPLGSSTTVYQTPPTDTGYIMVGQDGGVFTFGNAVGYGSLPGIGVTPSAPIISIVRTPDDGGYWLAGEDGAVYAFGDAVPYGGLPGSNIKPNACVVGMAATHDGQGYWLVGADGGIFCFGDAHCPNSLPGENIVPNQPIVGMAPTPDDGGYWMVGADGGVFTFGDAGGYGSLPGEHITPNKPVIGITPTADGRGYILGAQDGGVFTFGDAVGFGSLPGRGIVPNKPVIGIEATPDSKGYWMVAQDGGIFTFGDAGGFGSLPGRGITPNQPISGMAAE